MPHFTAAVQHRWSLSEWLHAFIEAELGAWENAEIDDFDGDHMPGGDNDYYTDDIDSDLLESLIILALMGVLAMLVYWRNQRQRREEERRRQAGEQQGGGAAAPVGAQQQQQQAGAAAQQQGHDRGLFPQPNDPDFLAWAAGGVGH